MVANRDTSLQIQEQLLQIVRTRIDDPSAQPIGHLHIGFMGFETNPLWQEEIERLVPSLILYVGVTEHHTHI